MESISKIFKRIRKDLSLTAVISSSVLAAIYGAVQATETNNNSTSQVETKLTAEEIDKIIEDLKISGNIDNIIEKLDEMIQRAQLSGNTALQEYATNMKTSYELQKQLDSVNSLIEAMKKKNTQIASVDEEVSKILSVDTIVNDLDGATSDECLLILQSLSDENIKKLQSTIAEIENLFDLNNVEALSVQQRSLLDIILLSKILEEEMLEGERLDLANNTLGVAVTILESYQKQNYPQESYDELIQGTERFLESGKKASSVLPEQVVFFDGYFNINHAPIMYDGHILLAIDDLYQYIDADIEHMYNNATMVINSPDKVLEIVSGKNIAYLNDKPYNMPVPILSFEDTIYMSVEFFAEAYDISFKYLPEYDFLVLYDNLVQLKNPSVANKLSKE